MVKWLNDDKIILIPHYKDYGRCDFLNTWPSRQEFFTMVETNFRQLELENYYRINFGYYWNYYYIKNRKGRFKRATKPHYYRDKYLTKLGFVVLNESTKNRNEKGIIKKWTCQLKLILNFLFHRY